MKKQDLQSEKLIKNQTRESKTQSDELSRSRKIEKMVAKQTKPQLLKFAQQFTMLDELTAFLHKRGIEIQQSEDFLNQTLQGNVNYVWYIFYKTKNIQDKLAIIELLSSNRECYHDLVQLTTKKENRKPMTLGLCDRLGREVVLFVPKWQQFLYRRKGFMLANNPTMWQGLITKRIGEMFALRATEDDVFWFWDLAKGKSPLRVQFIELLYQMPSQREKVISYCSKMIKTNEEDILLQKTCKEILSHK